MKAYKGSNFEIPSLQTKTRQSQHLQT